MGQSSSNGPPHISPKTSGYLRNCWYVIAHSRELGEQLFRRRILDEPVLLYRDGGDIVALEDRCPHRYAPLSMGRKVEGGVECPYHGLVFGADGVCLRNPHGDNRIPPSARVRKYPAVERYGLIWLWAG